ncbi:MAG: 6-bladed beta-propeller [Candidatus Kryptoniota bacterium]
MKALLLVAVVAVVFLSRLCAQPSTKLIQLRRDFGQISGIKVGEKGQIYVADLMNAKIFVFSPKGNFVWTIRREAGDSRWF